MIRFIHAADIHLDSPLNGLSAYPDAPVELLRGATRRAFEKLIDRAIEEEVDFIVIAGDLYDGTWRDHNTGIYFAREMGRLKKAGIPAFVLFGNHDAESDMTKKLEMPDNVRRFSARKAETHTLDDIRVALHGQSFKDRAITQNLALDYPAPVPGYCNIGVLHTALEGSTQHANYAPCTLAQLHAKGYDYWALGHVHDYALWQEQSTIVFPGNLQGRNIREQGEKGAVLVTVEDDGRVQVERLVVDVLRWQALEVEASACANLSEVVHAIGRQLEALVESAPALPHAVRVSITGSTAAHGELFGLGQQLRQEVLGQIAVIGNEHLWLEKVKVRPRPALDEAQLRERMDALADFQELLAEAAADPGFLADLKQDLDGFLAKAPMELVQELPALHDIKNGRLDQLVNEVAPALLAHLIDGEAAGEKA